MAYNPIAPTSSRENRKPPAMVPLPVYLAVDTETGLVGSVDSPDEADTEFVVDTTTGLVGSQAYTGETRMVSMGGMAFTAVLATEA